MQKYHFFLQIRTYNRPILKQARSKVKLYNALFCLLESLFDNKIGLSPLGGPPGGQGPGVPISRGYPCIQDPVIHYITCRCSSIDRGSTRHNHSRGALRGNQLVVMFVVKGPSVLHPSAFLSSAFLSSVECLLVECRVPSCRVSSAFLSSVECLLVEC